MSLLNDKNCKNITIFDYLNPIQIVDLLNYDSKKSDKFIEDFKNGNIIWDDKETMTKLVGLDPMLLEAGSDRIRKDIDVCYKAISCDLKAAKHVHKSIKSKVLDKWIKNTKNTIKKKIT